MTTFASKKAAFGLLLTCVILAAAGCHKSQNSQSAQNTAAQTPATPNAQSQSAAQPPASPNAGAPAPAPAASSAPAAPNTAANTAPAPPPPAPAPEPPPREAHHQSAPPAPATDAQEASAAPQSASVEVPDGTVLRIRINQRISVKTSHAGDGFDGTIVGPVTVNGAEVIPAGSLVQGQVVEAKRRGHFKGSSVLELTLTSLDVNGRHYRLDTSTVTRTKKGKGKRTAAFIGGGTGLGMLIGGVATGGVGLLIGGLSGAGAGTAGAAFTGNRDIDIPAETVMSFRLAQPIELR